MAAEDGRGHSFLPRTRKSRALLAILALASPKPVLRIDLAERLWSRREKEQARASLRQSVHELQDTLGPSWSHVFFSDRHHLSLRGEGLHIDAKLAMEPMDGVPAALGLFTRTLLEDLNGLDPAFDRWLQDERQRVLRVGRTLGESAMAKCSAPREAIEVAEQLLLIDRCHEGAWRTIMRSHAEQGDTQAALANYDRCRSALAEAGDGGPSPETEDLVAALRARNGGPRLTILPAPLMHLAPAAQAVPAARGAAYPAASPIDAASAPSPVVSGNSTVTALAPKRERTGVRLRINPLRLIGEDRDGFAVGLEEEIATGLSRFRWISCVPAAWTDDTMDGRAHGPNDADFVLEGTVQHGGNRVRTIVRLMDRRGEGEIVWAGRFDRAFSDALTLQDELSAAIVAQVDPELMRHAGKRPSMGAPSDPTAQDLLLQALPSIYRLDRDSFLDSRRLLEASLEADPASSVTHGWLAYWDLLYVGQGWSRDPAASSAEAARLAERAVTLDSSDARALTLAGHVRGFLNKRPEEAMALHERALALNPNLALAWCFSGLTHFYLGRHDEAVRRINQAIRLSPSDPHIFFFDMALILPNLMRGDCAAAVEAGRRAIEMNPLFSSTYKGYLAALGLAGRPREAQEVLRRLMQLEPGFSVEEAVMRSPLARPEDIARYAEGLRRAGLRERSGVLPAVPRMPGAERPGPDRLLILEHSPIDLAPQAKHSPAAMRDEPHFMGRLRNEQTW